MIGIICALQVEAQNLINIVEQKCVKSVSGIDFNHGKIEGDDVVIAVCGVGKVFAAICAEAMILNFNPDIIINTGVGGTLSSDLHIGDLAIATAVVQHDMDTSPLGDPVGLISGINKIHFETDKNVVHSLIEICKNNSYNSKCGVIACGDKFVSDNNTKEFITSEFGAIACDMESGAIGHVCFINGTKFAVLRAISDEADGSACDNYTEFVEASAKKGATIIKEFLKSL